MNDHPDLRPPTFYDRFFTDGLSTLYKRPLINDHPANATSDHGNLTFTPDERPSDRGPAHFLTLMLQRTLIKRMTNGAQTRIM